MKITIEKKPTEEKKKPTLDELEVGDIVESNEGVKALVFWGNCKNDLKQETLRELSEIFKRGRRNENNN